jgi:formylglycine-generating enzyme required for sulfatase activity
MAPDRRPDRISDLYHAALKRPPAERAAFLAASCGDDAALQQEVESLLAYHAGSAPFLEVPAAVALGRAAAGQTLIGQTLGSFRILGKLGEGGMGEVYRAHDPKLGRDVAIKILPLHFTADSGRRARFAREARALATLNHPNVCTIHALGEGTDGQQFIAMEYVDGETLRHRLMRHLAMREALDIVVQVASAVGAAHAAGVVHRDLKPENVMRRPDGLIKVLDFGLAKLVASSPGDAADATRTMAHTDAGTVLGTVAYMSPEQVRGREVDQRTDIWSLGVMLYEMVAGRSPFAGETRSDVIAAILDREPAPLARFDPDVPPELQRIVGKALRKDRDERYQGMRDLLLDLQTLREDPAREARSSHAEGRLPGATAPPPPLIAPSERLRAYCQRVLDDPRLQRYRIDERFVRMRVLLDQGREADEGRWADAGIEARDLPDLLAQLARRAPANAVVVLGAPGAGKSVLLRHLQTETARACLADSSAPIPFFVALNAYTADDPDPLTWLRGRWAEDGHGLETFDTMRREGRLLLMADALNEVGHHGDLGAVLDRWRDMLPAFVRDGNRAVFTCRTLDIGAGLSSPEVLVPQADVQPLSADQIREFLRHYASEHAEATFARITTAERQLTLYNTPFFLDLLVRQIRPDGTLPASRAALFAGFIRAALQREITARSSLFVEEGPDALLQERDRAWLHRPPRGTAPHELPARGPLIGRLSALAFAMQRGTARPHDESRESARQVRAPEAEVLAWLDHRRAPDIIRAAQQLNLLEVIQRARDTDVQFSHQLFQEFFAARVLAERPEPGLVRVEWRAAAIAPGVRELLDTLGRGERLPELPATGWEETTQVAAAMTPDADGLVRDLMAPNLPLAGRCAVAPGVTVSDPLRAELRAALVARSRDPAADLRARIDAALALGPLGDPRFERRTGQFGSYLLPPLVMVAGGTYRIGAATSSQESHEEIEVQLPTFVIGQFAVTNAEYQCFMDGGGYEDERWWEGDAARAWRNGEGAAEGLRWPFRESRRLILSWPDSKIKEFLEADRRSQEDRHGGEYADDWTMILAMDDAAYESWLLSRFPDVDRYTRPLFFDNSTFNAPLQPVVGVCWHEARAYCAWLSAQTARTYRLATEHEWEAAAHGRARRPYAYDGQFDAAKANTAETRLKRTTPIGVFPEGDTPDGISDLTGNSQDWTSSAGAGYDPSTVWWVVRGEPWYSGARDAHNAGRGRYPPDFRHFGIGFRVVCDSPIG